MNVTTRLRVIAGVPDKRTTGGPVVDCRTIFAKYELALGSFVGNSGCAFHHMPRESNEVVTRRLDLKPRGIGRVEFKHGIIQIGIAPLEGTGGIRQGGVVIGEGGSI